MNLGLFNRMNLKDNSENKGMYSEWTSLSAIVQNGGGERHSVLEKFGGNTSKEVTLGLVKHLAGNLGLTQPAEPSSLTCDKEVQWCMEVLCFGLSLPLSEHDALKDCVNVYCEWLSALLPSPKVCVPQPILDDPNIYGRKIISHLHYLFIPRKGEGADTIHRQAVLCHRVLRTLQQIARESKCLDRDTWETLLLFLLSINDTLLAPPTIKDDIADQLCERILSVLFEVWLIACAECFPSPPLWKTLRESCLNWRHRVALIEQWNRVNLALTSKVLVFMYGPSFPELKLGEDDIITKPMSNDCVAQSWYRFLKTIGNPVSLTKPEVISQTQKFIQYSILSNNILDPSVNPCLNALPLIFLKAIKGIAGQVDAFLGIAQPAWWENVVTGGSTDKNKDIAPPFVHSPTPPPQRRLAKSFSVAQSSISKGAPKSSLIGLTTSRSSAIPVSSSGPSSTSSFSSQISLSFDQQPKAPLAQTRAKCNSILHLFGEWLFDAAFIGAEFLNRQSSTESGKRPTSLVMDGSKSSITEPETLSPLLTIDKFESGKAEALGTLCRIMCAKKTGEEILPVYLARFYLAVQQGLKVPPSKECGESMVAILMNSPDIFRLDLDGVRVLVPAFVNALEIVLPDPELKKVTSVTKNELRKASIQILLSILVLPLHFNNVIIKELISSQASMDKPVTFSSLKLRLINLLLNALHVESDLQNTHMLLGGLYLCVQDFSTFENREIVQPILEAPSNIMSSASDAASSISMSSTTSQPLSPDSTYMTDIPKDSAHGVFVRATYIVCHRLISSWKVDLNVSLAALELLSGLARISIKESSAIECKRCVKWLCDFITHQCSRPPQHHSKDLHSTIVAAFHCCSVWLLEHPYLLKDKDCLTSVLEVAELGVSGTKSIGRPNEEAKMKEDKELKPVSIRVRDAAEHLLTSIFEQVGYFPSVCGPESISSLLDELSLLQHCNSWPTDCVDRTLAAKKFRYFVTEGSIMLGLLEEPLGNDQDPQPTVTILIRGPFGRHAWTMQLRHLPRHKSGTKYHTPNPGRPVVLQDTVPPPIVKQKYFPDAASRVNHCKADESIPTLESVLEKHPEIQDDAKKMEQLIERQVVAESALITSVTPTEFSAPSVCHDFQTARLFLSHFGLLNLEEELGRGNSSTLCALDSSASEFCRDLTILDAMSPRTCDTVHIFYVKSQQSFAQDIVSNTENAQRLSPYFMEFIHTLGWSVQVDKHPGWTGHISTSWNVSQGSQDEVNPNNPNPKVGYDGSKKVLYWSDACAEIAFLVPSNVKAQDSASYFNTNTLSSCYDGSSDNLRDKKSLSLDLEKQPVPPKRSSHRSSLHPHTNTKMMVVWLESFEDHHNFPIDDLLNCMNTGLEAGAITKSSEVLVIYLHLMEAGLLRVHLQGAPLPTGRVNLASPLIDGMVVSRRALGPLVRHTALNMSKRKRLDSENYQPPHVRRRLKVQEMVHKYKREMGTPELLSYLFTST